jgi:S-formylglutathione hydrolase FrmB
MRLRTRISLLILLVIAVAAGLLSVIQHSHADIFDRPQEVVGVRMQDVTFYSAALARTMPYRVYLPAKVAKGEQFPVVYLLHGDGGSFRDWSNSSDVAKYAGHGIIMVMPEGNSSYYMNAVDDEKDKYEDYITKDLIADVEMAFPARRDRESRAVVGVSMGGFAAIDYALAHPDLFAFAGALSPAVDVPSRRFSPKYPDQWWRFRAIFGPLGSKERMDRDPFELVKSADPRVTPFIYMTAGEQESLLWPDYHFAERLKERGFAYEFHTKPGSHDWEQWDKQVPGCFESLLTHLSISGNESATSHLPKHPRAP